MFGDSRPIALRRLLPFSKKFDARKHRNSDSIHSTDEEPLLMDEETGLILSPTTSTRVTKKPKKPSLWSRLKPKKTYSPRTISLQATDKEKRKYTANVIINQKYNIFTFIPIVLYEQFVIFFNLYFLLVALSQFIPALKIGNKEALDDYQRYKRDKEANSQLYKRLTPTGIQSIPSSKIRVGDLLYIMKDQRIPADMVLLRTTEETGASFIRTDQLDGETDWKLRLAVPSLQRLSSDQDLMNIRGQLYADAPHKDIHSFVGTITIIDEATGLERLEPLGTENTMWTNTVLASGSALGFVIYTDEGWFD
ncbi:hypothetical protein G6F56_005001 [Rhizopus delemar]|nr:hypothetical protein G6F56_005001 [Rhizopus delemar]